MNPNQAEKYDSLNYEVAARKKTGLQVPEAAVAARNHLFSLLTPESMKRELANIMYKLSELSANNNVDPRICNNPLPNDARLTRAYGHRSFISDCYPGFVWYNGFWYKETDTLKFSELSFDENIKLLSIPPERYQTALLKEGLLDMSVRMDDAFYPVKINGNRVFLREYWDVIKNDPRNFTYKYLDTIMYIPELQGCQKAVIHRFSHNDRNFVIEDTNYNLQLPAYARYTHNVNNKTKNEI